MRIGLLLLGLGLSAGAASEEEVATRARSVPAVCCKICSKGKACGDTCIARWKECHVGPGCACNAR